MLKDKPVFTYRIEAEGVLYEAKLNGVLIHEDMNAAQLATEEPVNHYMISGKNRIALYMYPWEKERYNGGRVSVSLYVRPADGSEADKRLIGQIAFNSNDLLGDEAEAIAQQKGISLSPTVSI